MMKVWKEESEEEEVVVESDELKRVTKMGVGEQETRSLEFRRQRLAQWKLTTESVVEGCGVCLLVATLVNTRRVTRG